MTALKWATVPQQTAFFSVLTSCKAIHLVRVVVINWFTCWGGCLSTAMSRCYSAVTLIRSYWIRKRRPRPRMVLHPKTQWHCSNNVSILWQLLWPFFSNRTALHMMVLCSFAIASHVILLVGQAQPSVGWAGLGKAVTSTKLLGLYRPQQRNVQPSSHLSHLFFGRSLGSFIFGATVIDQSAITIAPSLRYLTFYVFQTWLWQLIYIT